MALSYARALALLHSAFRDEPVATRVHILGRFFTCPFLRTLDLVEKGATVLDIGAGHGIFARLAVESGAARVVAVEPDLRKTLGRNLGSSIRFVAGRDEAVRGSFDLITMFDVLYRIPVDEWDALFRRVYARLSEGGSFVIKELDPENRWKFQWNRLQEAISDRFLKLTMGHDFAYESREAMERRLRAAGFTYFQAVDIDAGYPHSHILYVARK